MLLNTDYSRISSRYLAQSEILNTFGSGRDLNKLGRRTGLNTFDSRRDLNTVGPGRDLNTLGLGLCVCVGGGGGFRHSWLKEGFKLFGLRRNFINLVLEVI